MLGFIHRRGEDAAVVFLLLGRDIRLGRRIVVLVAVHRPELVSQGLQFGREVLVGGCGVGPDRVATRRRSDHRAQDRGLGVGIDEGHIGVPGVGPALAVQLQQEARALTHWHRGVGNRFTQQVREGFLALIVKVMLSAEKDHLVLHQGGLDGLDHGGLKVGAQLHPANLGTDASGHRVDVQHVADGRYGVCGIAHGMTLIWLL
ncbi:hypothetical protein D3C84_757490 [compost metagenome]